MHSMHCTSRRALAALTLSLVAACASAAPAQSARLDSLAREAAEPPNGVGAAESRLADHVTLDDVVAISRARNPSLFAARARVRASLAEARSATRLPDPSVKGEIWGAPLFEPYALNRADTLMIGVKQEIPLANLTSAKRDAAEAMAGIDNVEIITKTRDLEREVRAVWVRYRLAYEERALHDEHLAITQTTVDSLRAAQTTGRATEADVSAAVVALTRAHTELFALEADETSARVALNAWMARPTAAPLGPPADVEASPAAANPAPHDPDALLRARADALRADADVRVAADDANLPVIMAGIDYWFKPAAADPHAYGAMLSMSLPWLNPGRADVIDAAKSRSEAAKSELRASELDTDRMLGEARARLDSAKKTLAAIERDEVPSAELNVLATKNAFVGGAADAGAVLLANSMLLDSRMRRAQVRAELALARIDLARVVGDGGAE